MPRRQQTSQNEHCPKPESSVPPSQAEGDPGAEMRTRSGRRIRAPSSLLDSGAPSPAKTSSRRIKNDVQGVAGSEPSGDTAAPQGCMVYTDTDSQPEAKRLRSDAREPNSPAREPPAGVTPVAPGAAKAAGSAARGIDARKSAGSHTIPLGKPKSGRVWKNRNKQRFSSLLRDKPLRSSWEKKMEAKREKELVKKYALQLKEEKARQKEEKRKRREESLRRREENERKAEIVQVIRNPAKMKRMKKKQLRHIEKRDTLPLLQKAGPQNQSGPRKAAKRSQ